MIGVNNGFEQAHGFRGWEMITDRSGLSSFRTLRYFPRATK